MEKDSQDINKIVDKLCDDYKSHSYMINRSEAKEIGLKVINAPADVEQAMMDLYKFYIQRPPLPSGPPAPGQSGKMHLAWLDSTQLHLVAEAEVKQETGQLKMLGDKWVTY
jgi:hypothetical protein